MLLYYQTCSNHTLPIRFPQFCNFLTFWLSAIRRISLVSTDGNDFPPQGHHLAQSEQQRSCEASV
jgi:hypothetical protein